MTDTELRIKAYELALQTKEIKDTYPASAEGVTGTYTVTIDNRKVMDIATEIYTWINTPVQNTNTL